ncbi:hypothetical protein ACJ72_05015 [Emergomyces africanus]|uniref:Uncharacterized protein n=1 Tax=Emergomyces africanus TaxID=1955775 RepID=A0A1B7NV37_9EURO|nr:hypothetical protein ACJ72_05015 [Emergomyces africanus]
MVASVSSIGDQQGFHLRQLEFLPANSSRIRNIILVRFFLKAVGVGSKQDKEDQWEITQGLFNNERYSFLASAGHSGRGLTPENGPRRIFHFRRLRNYRNFCAQSINEQQREDSTRMSEMGDVARGLRFEERNLNRLVGLIKIPRNRVRRKLCRREKIRRQKRIIDA